VGRIKKKKVCFFLVFFVFGLPQQERQRESGVQNGLGVVWVGLKKKKNWLTVVFFSSVFFLFLDFFSKKDKEKVASKTRVGVGRNFFKDR
jgi:hypothetical protein